MKKVEVKSNGIVIGYTYDEGKTIIFLDNDEEKKVIDKLNTGTPIGISARRMGNVDKDGKVIDMSDINELGIVDMVINHNGSQLGEVRDFYPKSHKRSTN